MNLFGVERFELERVMTDRGLPAFRGRQIHRALYARGARSFEEMEDLPKGLRDGLASEHEIRRPAVVSKHVSRAREHF